MSPRSTPLVIGLLLTFTPGCREDTNSPTGLEATPTLATAAASAALSWAQVTAGNSHSCGVTTDYHAYCWGYGDQGGLGNGNQIKRLIPTAVAGGLLFRQLSADWSSTCGVTTDNRAYCWGWNINGHFGDGTTTRRLTPTAVKGGLSFRQISLDHYTSCGVTTTDRLYCWGNNQGGFVGDGTTIDRLTPVHVGGTLRFRQVSVGFYHTCAVSTTDEAYCWGNNYYAQLGDGTLQDRRTPVKVAGTLRFREVSAGLYFSCGVTTAQRLMCWGINSDGQLGNGTGSAPQVCHDWPCSKRPAAVAGARQYVHVETGHYYACAVSSEYLGYCWGNGTQGQLGTGNIYGALAPVAVAGTRHYDQIAVSADDHTCAVTRGSRAFCWGINSYGQLGTGTIMESYVPVAVVGP